MCVCQSSFIWPHLPLEIDILFQLTNINHQTGYCWSAVCCVCVNHRSSGHAFRWRLTSCSSWPASNIRQGTVGQPCVVCVCVNHRSSGHTFRWRLASCSSWPTSNTSQGTVGQPCVACVSIIVHLATPSAGD